MYLFNMYIESVRMDIERRIELITRPPTEEVITLSELRELLEAHPSPVAYDGFKPSGLAHLPFGVLRTIKLRDMLEAGCRFKIFLAAMKRLLQKFGT